MLKYLLMVYFILIVMLLGIPTEAFSAAALVQVQQAKMQKARAEAQAQYEAQQYQAMQYQAMQQQAAAQYVQVQQAQAYAQQQQMIQSYIQQQLAQRIAQEQIQQVEQALVMRYVQQQLAQQIGAAQAQQVQNIQREVMDQAVNAAIEKVAYQRALAQRDANAAQAYLQARNEAMAAYQHGVASAAVSQVAAARTIAQQQYQQQAAQQLGAAAMVAGMNKPYENVPPEAIRQIVGFEDLWKKLDNKATAWVLMIDNYAKVLTVKEYIERFRSENIKIGQTPDFYSRMIDDMAKQNPTMLDRPFKDVLQILAIMEYDFDNGMDRELLAQKALGEDFYAVNKKRLGR